MKRVAAEERIAVAAELRRLLASDDADGKRLWTQASLGSACKVSQETLRQAMKPDGVTPKVLRGLVALVGCSVAQLVAAHAGQIERARYAEPNTLESAARDMAIEILIRRNWSLRQSRHAVEAARTFTEGEPGAPNPMRWAKLGEAILLADDQTKGS